MATFNLPWFPLYATELLSDQDFSLWTLAERGCWLTLSARCWADGSIPIDTKALATLCSTPHKDFLKVWTRVSAKFHPINHTRLVSIRIEEERLKAITKAEAMKKRGQIGALARWSHDQEPL